MNHKYERYVEYYDFVIKLKFSSVVTVLSNKHFTKIFNALVVCMTFL